jgi:hypothetical protein
MSQTSYPAYFFAALLGALISSSLGCHKMSWNAPGKSALASDSVYKPFSCSVPGTPGATDIQRLTKYELNNTLIDIFGAVIVSEVKSRFDALPRDNTVEGFDTIERSVSALLIQAQFDLANALATQAVSTDGRLTAIAGTCFTAATLTDACLETFIRNIGLKIFRRPVSPTEVSDMKSFYLANDPSRREGAQIVLSRLLQSPDFFYRLEAEGAIVAPDTLELTAFELASRLSYTVWGTMPDAELFAKAADGSIKTETVLRAQFNRLLASERARAHVRNFYRQWLKMGDAITFGYSPEFLEGISGTGMAAAMEKELDDFVDYVVWTKKGSVDDLLLSDEAIVTHDGLAAVYKVSKSVSPATPVRLPAGERSGLTTRAGFVASGDDDTHPFRRGSKVLSRLLCYNPPRPDSDSLPEGALDEPEPDPTVSTRHRFETKTLSPMCMGCHSQINPFAFSLENFDSLGRFRTLEKIRDPESHAVINTVFVDAKAAYSFPAVGTRQFDGPVQMSRELASSGVVDACFVRQWYRFSKAKLDSAQDHCALQPMHEALTASGGSILKVIETSVMDKPFRLRRLSR